VKKTTSRKENRRRAAERQARRAERKAKLADAWHAKAARDKAKQATEEEAVRYAFDQSRLLLLLRHRHKAGGRISMLATRYLEKYCMRVFCRLDARKANKQVRAPSVTVSYPFRSTIRSACACEAWEVISGEYAHHCQLPCPLPPFLSPRDPPLDPPLDPLDPLDPPFLSPRDPP
jgi:hypothetical protein